MMKDILKRKAAELAGDESGVAFAFTVTVALIIFLFGFSVYAIGETVRERMELQNAADAAAYSGALVQADTVSRIAVINKAMAWNYVMMTRRQMDHIVDTWLSRVVQSWNQSRSVTAAYQNICACHPRVEAVNWRVGVSPGGQPGEVVHTLIRINGTQDVSIPAITSAQSANAPRNPVSLLSSLRSCIKSMNQAETELISGMKSRVEQAVEFAVNADVSLTENDNKVQNKREIRWTLYNLKDASAYFETLSGDEARFLGFGGFKESPQTVYGTGADTWLVNAGSSGFRRDYTQAGSTLSAMWFTYNQIWWHGDFCVFGGVHIQPVSPVTGEMARDEFFTGVEAKPQVLKENYFDKDGAVVVGVSRPLNNPFAFVFGGGKQAGIYSAFSVGEGNQTMWSVSAARAGYRLSGWKKGEYRASGKIEDKDNLCEADWDAVFLSSGDDRTADSGMLEQLAQKLGATRQFAGKDRNSGYSEIAFSEARNHLHH